MCLCNTSKKVYGGDLHKILQDIVKRPKKRLDSEVCTVKVLLVNLSMNGINFVKFQNKYLRKISNIRKVGNGFGTIDSVSCPFTNNLEVSFTNNILK